MFDYKAFLKTVPECPGVYCMKDTQGKVLYVGKAKDLKKRLSSYFQRTVPEIKTQHLVARIFRIELTITETEREALLLENSLIKSLKPKYNVIFKDDKSYPYLFVSKHAFPRLVYYRGKQSEKGDYFGPYSSVLAVKETLNLLQKNFKIRQCEDLFFKSRSRPCLQYQIKRCSAPCVNYITEENYRKDVYKLKQFLTGKNSQLIESMITEMKEAAESQSFEKAAECRDQIISLRSVFEQQSIYGKEQNIDVCAIASGQSYACIHHLLIRQGRILSSQSYYTKKLENLSVCEILRTFIIQHYLNQTHRDWPYEIIINEPLDDVELIVDALVQHIGRKVTIGTSNRGDKAQWLKLAFENATSNLKRRLDRSSMYAQRYEQLKLALKLDAESNNIECFDISHTQGVETRASCVVFNEQGPHRSAYRIYRIKTATNDDYQSMYEVLTRRYLKIKEQNHDLPSLVIIDGGKGQLNIAKQVFDECQIAGVKLIAIAKGKGRKPGLETIFVADKDEILTLDLPPFHPALHILQYIRDEAHRFAITKHRSARQKKSHRSVLDDIPGVGEKRKMKLIQHFGGLQSLLAASEASIQSVPGISPKLAQKIYQTLHEK